MKQVWHWHAYMPQVILATSVNFMKQVFHAEEIYGTVLLVVERLQRFRRQTDRQTNKQVDIAIA